MADHYHRHLLINPPSAQIIFCNALPPHLAWHPDLQSPYLNFQVEIPFIVWMSDKYKDNNPEIVENIIKNQGKPYTTDYVAHTILDMAGVSCPQFMPNRSVANNLFQIINKKTTLIIDKRCFFIVAL